jgi:hypothetical protein
LSKEALQTIRLNSAKALIDELDRIYKENERLEWPLVFVILVFWQMIFFWLVDQSP